MSYLIAKAAALSGALILALLPAGLTAQSALVREIDQSAPVISRGDILINVPLATIWSIQTNVDNWSV